MHGRNCTDFASEILRRKQHIPGNSRQGRPTFHYSNIPIGAKPLSSFPNEGIWAAMGCVFISYRAHWGSPCSMKQKIPLQFSLLAKLCLKPTRCEDHNPFWGKWSILWHSVTFYTTYSSFFTERLKNPGPVRVAMVQLHSFRFRNVTATTTYYNHVALSWA